MPAEIRNVMKVVDPMGRAYFLGVLSPAEIKALTFVPCVTSTYPAGAEDPQYLNERPGGYQRSGDPKRMQRIKEFVAQRPNCLVPPVVLSARGKWEFVPQGNAQVFGKLIANDLAAIIDGQHRLGGLWRLANATDVPASVKGKPIPFMVVLDMDEEEEKREFVDINDNQQGVKKSLLRWLNKEDNFSGRAASALAGDEESVFLGRVDEQKKRDHTLFLFGAAVECVQLTFRTDFTVPKGFDPHKDEKLQESAIEMLLTFWRKVRDNMPTLWSDMYLMPPVGQSKSKEYPGTSQFRYRLLEETGIRAMSRLAGDIFSRAWVPDLKQPAWDAVEHYLRRLNDSERVQLVLTKHNRNPAVLQLDQELRSTGKAGVTAIHRHLVDALNNVKFGGQ